MNLWFRILTVLWSLRRRPRLEMLETSVLEFRVFPNDLDINFHMNNGRYLTLMDLGRLDLVARTGLGKEALRLRWRPIVGSAFINFRKELNPLQKFRLESRILGWVGRWFYIQQRFYRDDVLCAEAVVKALMADKNGPMEARKILDTVGFDEPSPVVEEKIIERFAR